MARIRSAKPDFWTDPIMCALSRDVRFTFKGLWEVCADDHGRFLADVRVIKGQVWPLDDDLTLRKLERFLIELAERGRILLYTQFGVRYGYIVNWQKHQKVSHPSPSRFPDPFSGNPPDQFPNNSGNPPERFTSDSVLSGAERIREERRGSGAEGARDEWLANGAERPLEDPPDDPIIPDGPPDVDVWTTDEDRAAPPAPLVELPREAEQFLERFYSLGTDKRRLDVRRQVYDTIDPTGRGARLRRGVHVKARDAEHLARCCEAVLEDPPRSPDAAIVILLEKLQDPIPGPTPSERHKAETTAAIAEEEAYHREAHAAGVRWANENPEEFEPIRAEVDAQFPTGKNAFAAMARNSALTARCARAAGFPDFAAWQAQRHNHQFAGAAR